MWIDVCICARVSMQVPMCTLMSNAKWLHVHIQLVTTSWLSVIKYCSSDTASFALSDKSCEVITMISFYIKPLIHNHILKGSGASKYWAINNNLHSPVCISHIDTVTAQVTINDNKAYYNNLFASLVFIYDTTVSICTT